MLHSEKLSPKFFKVLSSPKEFTCDLCCFFCIFAFSLHFFAVLGCTVPPCSKAAHDAHTSHASRETHIRTHFPHILACEHTCPPIFRPGLIPPAAQRHVPGVCRHRQGNVPVQLGAVQGRAHRPALCPGQRLDPLPVWCFQVFLFPPGRQAGVCGGHHIPCVPPNH